jgi:anti-anti-sigma factor
VNSSTNTETAAGVLRLSGALDIYGAESLRDTLQARLRSGDDGEIVVDLGDVGTCDTSAIQLLLSTRRTAAGSGRALRFVNLSAGVRGSCKRLGVREDI